MKRKFGVDQISKIYFVIGIVLILVSFLILLISLKPGLWYSINEDATEEEAVSISTVSENLEKEENPEQEPEPEEDELPPFDPRLPEQNTLIISSIGVNGPINQNRDPDIALRKGLWIVPDFGTPDVNELPIIIAAHRFGYITWTEEFRTENSFYNLPQLRTGERAKIIWGQRSYEYEVYKIEEGPQITDYEADLILYTCKLFNSPTRVFRYLNRVN